MKKNANILLYLENYKKKYDIKYAEEGSKIVKIFSILSSIAWFYSFFFMAITVLSFKMNFNIGKLDYNSFKKVFWISVVCLILMAVAAAFFVCRKKIVGLIIAIIVQPVIVFAFKPLNVYGMGYRPKFYFGYVIPAVLTILICGIFLFLLIRAIVQNNNLYARIVDDLYKQHGTKNGEKLSEEEWQKFLTDYDPYK